MHCPYFVDFLELPGTFGCALRASTTFPEIGDTDVDGTELRLRINVFRFSTFGRGTQEIPTPYLKERLITSIKIGAYTIGKGCGALI